jgi:phage host-nuclease inhibitor protein Gam
MSNVVADHPHPSGLIAVSENTPPITAPGDAEVDLEILKSVPKKFEIIDEKTANWLVKKVIAARQYAANVALWAELEKRRAQREETTLMFLFGRQIENWTKTEVERLGGRRKSVALPAGTVGYRLQPLKLIVDDEAAVMSWASQHCPAAIQTIEKLVKTPLNEHFEKTGEVAPHGINIEPATEKFFIR